MTIRTLLKPCLISATLLIQRCSGQQRCVNPDVVDQTYVHKYGVTVEPNDWSTRGKHGHVISTLANGVKVTHTYQSGILEGETSYTFPHSDSIAKNEIYNQGKLVNETTFYHSGSQKLEIQHLDGNERTFTVWYESGSPQKVETYRGDYITNAEYYTVSNQPEDQIVKGNGTRINRDSYGQLISHDSIAQGEVIKCTTFHSNGTPSEIIPYTNGIVEGERMTFLPGGEPNTVEEWSGGKQHGITIHFQNGEKFAEIPYVNGGKQGTERHYRDGVTVVEEIAWVDNQKHGLSKAYIGETVCAEWFYRGQPVNKGNYDRLKKLQK